MVGVFHQGCFTVRILQDIADFLGQRIATPGNIHRADAQDGQVGDEPFFPVIGYKAYLVAPFDAQGNQAGAEDLYLFVELPVAGGLKLAFPVFAQLSDLIRILLDYFFEHFGNGFFHKITPRVN